MDTAKEPGRVAFKIVKQAKTVDNPDGNPYLALENLTNKYEAKTAPNFIELKGQFTNSKLSNDEDDPDEWITHLEALRTRMNEVQLVGKSTKSDTDIILHILTNVSEAYEMQVNEMETILKKDPRTVTTKTVREKLNGRFARIQKSRGVAPDNDHDKSLSAVAQCLSEMSEENISLFVKQFKGLCNKCGKFGHKVRIDG